MLGIQEPCSSNDQVRVRSNWNTSGSETRNPMNEAVLAQSLIRRGFDDGRKSSTSRPANGVKRTIERMWSIGADWRAYITTSRDDNGYIERVAGLQRYRHAWAPSVSRRVVDGPRYAQSR